MEKEDTRNTILAFLPQRDQAAADKPSDGNRNEIVLPLTSHTRRCRPVDRLREEYDHYTQACSELTNADISSLDTELENYLRQPRIPRSANIYAYWHSSQFPHLEPAARKYLPTSIASEQLFSAAGQIYDDRRSNLLGHNAEKILFLSYNIRLFNYDY